MEPLVYVTQGAPAVTHETTLTAAPGTTLADLLRNAATAIESYARGGWKIEMIWVNTPFEDEDKPASVTLTLERKYEEQN